MEERLDDPEKLPPDGQVRQPMQLNWSWAEGIDWDAEGSISLEEMEAMLAARSRRPVARLRDWRLVLRDATRRRRAVLVARWQRAHRGWADADWWALDEHLCRHLGALLLARAEKGSSHPHGMTHEEWTSQVQAAGEALLAYDGDDSERVARAQQALRWTAAHLSLLWD